MDHHEVINALPFTNPAPAPAPVFDSKTQGGHEFGPLTKNLAPLENPFSRIRHRNLFSSFSRTPVFMLQTSGQGINHFRDPLRQTLIPLLISNIRRGPLAAGSML